MVILDNAHRTVALVFVANRGGAMILVRRLFCIGVLLTLVGCGNGAMKELEKEMGQYGFTPYNPPRANHGPGWVFQFAKTFDGKTVPTTLCNQLMGPGTSPVIKADVSFPEIKRDHTFEANLGLSFVKDLLKDEQKTEAELKSKSVSKLRLSWTRLVAEEIPRASLFTPEGKLVPLDPTCSAQLKALKDRGELLGVIVVTEALRADKMEIDLQTDSSASVSATVNVKAALELKPGVSASATEQNTLSIDEPRYVGFRAFSLVGFAPTGLLGAETARISGAPLTVDAIRALVSK